MLTALGNATLETEKSGPDVCSANYPLRRPKKLQRLLLFKEAVFNNCPWIIMLVRGRSRTQKRTKFLTSVKYAVVERLRSEEVDLALFPKPIPQHHAIAAGSYLSRCCNANRHGQQMRILAAMLISDRTGNPNPCFLTQPARRLF